MWDVYDDLTVLDCMFGLHWNLVRLESCTGVAMTIKGGQAGSEYADIIGRPLQLFNYGIDTIGSTVLLNKELVWKVVKQGGQMVSIQRCC